MLYNDLVETIKTASEEINESGTFVHGRRADGSLNFPGKFPQIHLYPFTSNIDVNGNGETSNILMGFWYQDKPDSSPKQKQELISKADTLCRSFLKQILSLGTIQLSNVRVEPQYQMMAGTLSGYALSFTITSPLEIDC